MVSRRKRLRNDPTTQKFLLPGRGRKGIRIDNVPSRAREVVTSNRERAANRRKLKSLEKLRDKHQPGCAEYNKAQRAIDTFLQSHDT